LRICYLLAICSLSILGPSRFVSAQLTDVTAEELTQRLNDPDTNLRRDAAYELVRRRADTESVVRAFAKATSDSDTQVRLQALMGLARAGSVAEPAVNELVKCLNDRDAQIRFRAADALGKIGPAAVQSLIETWPRSSEQTKLAVVHALSTIGPAARPADAILQEALSSSAEDLPRLSAEALMKIFPQDESMTLILAKHTNEEVRRIGVLQLTDLPELSEAAKREMQRAISDANPKLREIAVVAIHRAALPDAEKENGIEAGLLDDVAAVRMAALVAVRKADFLGSAFAQRIASRLDAATPEVLTTIVDALALLGEDARETLPNLLDAAAKGQPADREAIAKAVARFGAATVPDLLAAIEARPDVEPTLSRALALIGEPAMDAMMAGLNSDSKVIRIAATRALGDVDMLSDEALQRLVTAVKDPDSEVRAVAVTAVIAASGDTEAVRATLLQASHDPDASVRAAAIAGVPQFSFSEQARQDLVARGLVDNAPGVRAQTLAILGSSSKPPEAFQESIVRLANDEDVQVREQAIITLGKFPANKVEEPITRAMKAALSDQALPVQIAATESLRQLEPNDAEALQALAANLEGELELQLASLKALNRFHQSAGSLTPVVTKLLQHERPEVRRVAVQTLSVIEQEKSRLAQHLLGMLDDPEADVRQLAGSQLGKLGPVAKGAVPKLFALLSSEVDSDFASSALREIDAAPIEALPMLLENLESEERRVGFYAVSLLGKIGPPAAEALPKLEALLESSGKESGGRSDFRKRFLREAIAAIKGEPKP